MAELLRGLGTVLSGPATALIVPVLGLPLKPRHGALPYHMTVLYPFVGARRAGPRLTRALVETFGSVPAFDFTLTAVHRFPDVLYLVPEPAAPFVALTELASARWPDHPPYGGAYSEVIPHLTLWEGPEPVGLADSVAAQLPLCARAEALWLMQPAGRGQWRRAAEVPLGSRSPDSRR
jgi:hypothetical protein